MKEKQLEMEILERAILEESIEQGKSLDDLNREMQEAIDEAWQDGKGFTKMPNLKPFMGALKKYVEYKSETLNVQDGSSAQNRTGNLGVMNPVR